MPFRWRMGVACIRRFAWVSLWLLACSGRTANTTGPGGPCGENGACVDAGPLCANGETKPAGDGCNTCSCLDGQWACTLLGCPTPECATGQTKPADDGCNTCSCAEGKWACTMRPCPTPTCIDGQTMAAGCNNCQCSGGEWVCTGQACPTPECTDGQTKTAPDACNTCSCMNGHWACTTKACPPPCKQGDTKPADDGCNTCVCGGTGVWSCTSATCTGPAMGTSCGGFLGATCAADEYCAYMEGTLCGAADASSTCRKRPTSCPLTQNPVCGCNNTTYDNACLAAVAGNGVSASTACAR